MNPYYDLVPSLPTHDNNWLFGQPLPDFAHLLPLFDTFAQPTDQENFAAERLRKYQREKGGELDVLLAHQIRMFLTVAYSWAIPSPEALDLIASLGPLLEVGAGNGYWARLLRWRGADVLAVDNEPRQIAYSDVTYGDAAAFAAQHPKRTLLLIWPPLGDPMALDALRAYQGRTVIYIGEWRGCTAEGGFHDELGLWERVRVLNIPQWEGSRDKLYVFRRAA